MRFCSISGKMASFLVRKYSENDVQVTSISDVQSTFWHNVQPTNVEIQRSKNFCISTCFGRSKIVTTKEERPPYVKKLRLDDVEILRPYNHITFFNSLRRPNLIRRSSDVHYTSCAQWASLAYYGASHSVKLIIEGDFTMFDCLVLIMKFIRRLKCVISDIRQHFLRFLQN